MAHQMPLRHMHGRLDMHVVFYSTFARGRCLTPMPVGMMASSKALRHYGQCTLQRSVSGTGALNAVHIGELSWAHCHGLVERLHASAWQHMITYDNAWKHTITHDNTWLVWLLGLEPNSAWLVGQGVRTLQ